jgi:AcrR family transcriptional regulator
VTGVRGADGRTRKRLIAAATRLFAERGFKYVTVRAICREARANIAAVNYHFRDKMGLYREVLEAASVAMREATDAAIRAGEGGTPEDKLRAYIRVHCEPLFAAEDLHSLQQLIHRELNDPTEAFTALIDLAFRPRFEYLSRVVADLVGADPDDQDVIRCTASIHGQVITFRPNVAIEHMKGSVRRAFRPRGVADHITRFSLAGLEAYRRRAGA